MSRLEGKIAIVTGASSGIGRAAALLFAREGAKVVVTARNGNALAELTDEIAGGGGEAAALAGDVGDEALHEALVELAVRRFGGLDTAFNNAGALGAMGEISSLSVEGWRETLDTNLTSAFLAAKYQVPAIAALGGGSLTFTSSFVGHTAGFAGVAGLIGLVQALAVELGARGIRVNALLPGGTDTPANFANLPGAAPETRGFVEGLHALKRIARPEEIAEAALYLASDGASFVTGAALLADGGASVTKA
ncbi:SDR family oxidoreductase [Sinorhizobium meliloti]|nr:SDR family oxidoreductase [Sinorhizobium meliloti]MDX0269598.1 SDR family oxidoreductase [Sinorhizobium meliloti]